MKVALLSIVLFATAQAAEIPPRNWQVRAELLVIRVPQREGIVLASRWADPKKCETAFEEAQALLATGKAKLVADLISHAPNGQRAAAELAEEIRYPIEWGMADRFHFGPKDESKLLASSISAFETQTVGVGFESISHVALDGSSLDVRASVRSRWFQRMRRFEHAVLKGGTKLFFEAPIFHEANNDGCAVHLRSGETALLGTHLLTDPAGTMELRLLTARTKPGALRKKERIAEEAPKGPDTWQVRIELQNFIVPELRAITIRSDAAGTAKSDAVFGQLLAGTLNGKVKLASWSLLPTFSSEHAVSETVSLQRYETEFSQPQGGGGMLTAWRSSPSDGVFPPFAMERRDIGHRTELESAVSADGRAIELMLRIESGLMHGFTRWAGNADAKKIQGFRFQPAFSKSSISSSLVLESGVRRCVGFQKLQGGDGKIELTFIKATATPTTR